MFLRSFCIVVLGVFLVGCHRAPRTAAELQAALPHQFRGDILMQGTTEPHTLVVEPHEWSVRDEHLLEFNKVHYQIVAGGESMAEGDADLRGTISVPDLVIRIERAGDAGGEAVKTDTFKGQLSADLHTATAEWASELGQRMTLKVTATTP